MGASGWNYFVPYEADISAALQRLREEVFARCDYAFGHGMPPEQFKKIMEGFRPHFKSMIELHLKRAEDTTLGEHFRAAHREMANSFRKQLELSASDSPQIEQKPTTIEGVLNKQAENGTHSILDIVCISPKPKFGAISPFPRSKIIEFFGSETPSHIEIEEAYEFGSLEKHTNKRWQGIYIIAYRNGSPHEIFFAGCSGD